MAEIPDNEIEAAARAINGGLATVRAKEVATAALTAAAAVRAPVPVVSKKEPCHCGQLTRSACIAHDCPAEETP